MKPGNPWSVKGIQPAARQAAKEAAKRHGMTLGQWLNHVIMDGNEEKTDSPAEQPTVPEQHVQQQTPPPPPPPAEPQPVAAEEPKSQHLQDKIEDLAARLDSIVNKQSGQVDLDQWQAAKGRSSGWSDLAVRNVEGEKMPGPAKCPQPENKSEIFGDRISVLTEKLDSVVQARAATKTRSDQNLMELEAALRNVISHIEVSDRQNTDVMQSIQTRLSELSTRNAASDDETVQQLTGSLGEMKDRLSHLSQRVMKTEAESNEFLSFEEKIKTLANRLDNSLDRETEPQILALEERTKQLSSQLSEFLQTSDETDTTDQHDLRIDELTNRIQNAEQHYHRFSSLEDSVSQLFEAVEQNRSAAQENTLNASRKSIETMETMVDKAAQKAAENAAQRSAEHVAAIMADDGLNKKEISATIANLRSEMLNLQETTLNAARSSAEETLSAGLSDQTVKAIAEPMMVLRQEFDQLQDSSKSAELRNQDTLEAVHDTLEKVVERLVTLEATPLQHPERQPLPLLSIPEINRASSAKMGQSSPLLDENDHEPSQETLDEDPETDTVDQRIDPTFGDQDDAQSSTVKKSAESSAPAINNNYLEAARRAAQAASQMPRNIPDASEEEDSETGVKKNTSSMVAESSKKRKTLLLMAAAVLLVIGALSAGSLIKEGSSNIASSSSDRLKAIFSSEKSSDTKTKTNKNPADDQATPPAKIAKPAISPVSQNASQTLAKATQMSKSVPAPQKLNSATPAPDVTASLNTAASPEVTSSLPPKIVTSAATLNELTGTKQTQPAANPVKVAKLNVTLPNQPDVVSDVSRTEPLGQVPPEAIGPEALRRAAAQGDPTAQFEIAARFTTGKLVPQNFGKAIFWYQKAAAQGLAPAQYRLGTFYEKGRGVAKDKTAARIWYERAAAKGNLKAIHNLAVIHADGSKGQPDFAKAGLWFRKAAELGLADSQYNLAILHDRGLGVSKDSSKAYFWFQIAGSQGDKDAAARAAIIEKRMTPEEIARTKILISNWSPVTLNKSANEVSLPFDGWQSADIGQTTLSAARNSSFTQKQLVILAQGYLARLGFDPGPRDGIMGTKTRDAVEEFQQQHQLPVSGNVSRKLVNKLKAAAG